MYETFIYYAEVLVFKAAAITVSNDERRVAIIGIDDVMNTVVPEGGTHITRLRTVRK